MVKVLAAVMLLAGPLWADEIRVAAAISLKEPIEAAAANFEQQTGHDVEVSFAASGALASQIERGAPIDLFISAAQKQIDQLQKQNAIDADVRTVARNRLVLVAPKNGRVKSFDDLKTAQRVALGEPRTVPAGEYGLQALAKLGLAESLKGRLLFAANVRQVLDYVRRGEVDAGMVYHTDAVEAGNAVTVVATAGEETHQPILYPAAVVAASKHKPAARQFVDFLLAPQQQKALAQRGFTPADAKP